MNFYQRLDKLKDITEAPWGGIPHDYPMFFRFTSEDKDRIQRNYIRAINEGLSPDFRKICITNSCEEGFSLRELMEVFDKIEEVSEEEFNTFADIPHWNPIKILDGLLIAYVHAVEEIRQVNANSLELHKIIQKHNEEFLTARQKEIDALPGGRYKRDGIPTRG